MTILEKIVTHKREELHFYRSQADIFAQTFSDEKKARVIGEVKIASPSFDLSDRIDVQGLVDWYGTHEHIAAMSILIDEKYFNGDIARIRYAKKYQKPIFFKEFVIERKQLDGAAYFGYDGALILKRILTNEQVIDLALYAHEKGIYPIIEVDNENDLERVFSLDIGISFGIGINCRNLGTMEIDRNVHFKLYEKYPQEFTKHTMFAFSGVDSLDQVSEYDGKYNGVLIGTGLVKQYAGR